MAPQKLKRNPRRILRAVTATGVAAAIAMSSGGVHASSPGHGDLFSRQVDQMMINNLVRKLGMEKTPVEQAYQRIVMDPADTPERDEMVADLAQELKVKESDMDFAFDAAWEHTMQELDQLNQDQFETWTGYVLVGRGEITAAQAEQANQWFDDRPAELSPLTLLAAFTALPDENQELNELEFITDAQALVDIGMITEDEAEDLKEWHEDRPTFLPQHPIVTDPKDDPTGAG